MYSYFTDLAVWSWVDLQLFWTFLVLFWSSVLCSCTVWPWYDLWNWLESQDQLPTYVSVCLYLYLFTSHRHTFSNRIILPMFSTHLRTEEIYLLYTMTLNLFYLKCWNLSVTFFFSVSFEVLKFVCDSFSIFNLSAEVHLWHFSIVLGYEVRFICVCLCQCSADQNYVCPSGCDQAQWCGAVKSDLFVCVRAILCWTVKSDLFVPGLYCVGL